MTSYVCKTFLPSRDPSLVPHRIIMTKGRQNIDILELSVCIPIRKVTKQVNVANDHTIIIITATAS